MRRTTSPVWEKDPFVGKTTSYTLPNVKYRSLEVVLGPKAIDEDGNVARGPADHRPPYRRTQDPDSRKESAARLPAFSAARCFRSGAGHSDPAGNPGAQLADTLDCLARWDSRHFSAPQNQLQSRSLTHNLDNGSIRSDLYFLWGERRVAPGLG